MTTFPLALPSSQPEPQPAVDLGGGTMATLRYATGLAPFAEPVIEQFRRHHEAGNTEDGLRTMVGFGFWQLRQDRETQFAITAPDYAAEDFVDATTDDLTLALWIEAAQADVLSRADVDGAPIDMAMGVTFTKAALTVVERGRTDELVLVRRPSTSEDDSGWLVRTAEKSFLRNKEVEILAGLLVQTAAYLVPLLALPTGTMARVADGRFLGAWATRATDGTVTDADRQLLDADGRGAGAPIGEQGQASATTTETIEEVVDGVTLRARIHPRLAPLAGSVLMAFAAGAAGPLEPGARLQMSYAPYTLEATDEGGVLLVTTPDFSSPEAYRERTTDGLTGACSGRSSRCRRLARRVSTRRRSGPPRPSRSSRPRSTRSSWGSPPRSSWSASSSTPARTPSPTARGGPGGRSSHRRPRPTRSARCATSTRASCRRATAPSARTWRCRSGRCCSSSAASCTRRTSSTTRSSRRSSSGVSTARWVRCSPRARRRGRSSSTLNEVAPRPAQPSRGPVWLVG